MAWLYVRAPAPPGVTSSQLEQLQNYWPLGSQLAATNRPHSQGDRGGEGATQDRYSLLLTGFEENPPYDETATVHIVPDFPGEDGYQLVSTVHPYDKVVGIYTQPGYRAVPAWEQMEFGPEHRPEVQWQYPAGGQLETPASPTRSAVNETDYHLSTLTSDTAMYGDSGYEGVDWNAY